MKRIFRSVGRILFTALPLMSLLLLHTPSAAAHPVITYDDCDSGGSQFICFIEYSGTVGDVTVRWDFYVNNTYKFSAYSPGLRRSCQGGIYYSYYVYVTDTIGTAQAVGGVYCNPGMWQ